MMSRVVLAAFAQRWNAGWAGRGDLAGRVVIGFGVAARYDVDTIYAEMTAAGHRGLQGRTRENIERPITISYALRYLICPAVIRKLFPKPSRVHSPNMG
jgi:hypothetical protein